MRKIFLLTLLLCTLFWGAVAEAARITDVRWGVNNDDVLRFVVDVTDTAGYSVSIDDNILKLKVNAVKDKEALDWRTIKSSVANSMQVIGKENYTVVRVPLKQKLTTKNCKAFVLQKDDKTGRPFRVVLDVTPLQKKVTNSTASTATSTTTSTTTAVVSTKPVAINSTSSTSGVLAGKNITLDAGHGGSDPGAIGSDGTKEKDITLPITLQLKELLEKKGAKVYMTRTTDVDVYGVNASDVQELQARVNVGEKYKSDIFVSLHINSSVNKSVGGFSTYYYPKTSNDLRLANSIQSQLTANFGLDDLGVRQANFYVIKRISMPATLVEMCFISNEKELTLMKGQWFQKKVARLIADGIENYFA